MSTAVSADSAARIAFYKGLQGVTNRIHATRDVEEIMLELTRDICQLFQAERITLYAITPDRCHIVTMVKTGLNGFAPIRLPIGKDSIAGYVAAGGRAVNISDVYDAAELARIDPELAFQSEVDKRSGFRSRQMLVAPIVDWKGILIGVVQLINHKPGGRFPPLLEEGVQTLAQTLAVAYSQRMGKHQPFKGKYDGLVADGILSAEELSLAQRAARRKNRELEFVLLEEFGVSAEALGKSLGAFFEVPYHPFRGATPRPTELLRNLKRDYVESNRWLPLEEDEKRTLILTTDPEHLRSSRLAHNVLGRAAIEYRVTTLPDFARYVELFFGDGGAAIGEMLSDMAGDEESSEGTTADELSAATDNELVRLVNKIITDAANLKASDIHIEPYPGKQKTMVRFRRDGVLVPYIEIPATYRNPLITRLKIMADLDISERRKPQDGKIRFKKFGPLDIELRVATLPSASGVEDVVLRILASGEPIVLDKLGLSPDNLSRLKNIVAKPYGLFFVCGPTGSGKTTTLHSVLGHINTPDRKIWTAEDPVEITQRGLRQIQVNRKAGLDFATIMRAFLRADPDVIMVGEMRDKETVSTGIEASLTGHLVLSTLHTNSAPESVVRLLDMGMDPFNFSDALLGVLAQRLARRLCVKCKEAYTPEAAEFDHLVDEYTEELRATPPWLANAGAERAKVVAELRQRFAPGGKLTLYRARGCEACGNTGYSGRLGLHELMGGSPTLKKQIQNRAPVADMVATALAEGMRTLKMDGIEKVLQGLTDFAQVRSVCIK